MAHRKSSRHVRILCLFYQNIASRCNLAVEDPMLNCFQNHQDLHSVLVTSIYLEYDYESFIQLKKENLAIHKEFWADLLSVHSVNPKKILIQVIVISLEEVKRIVVPHLAMPTKIKSYPQRILYIENGFSSLRTKYIPLQVCKIEFPS